MRTAKIALYAFIIGSGMMISALGLRIYFDDLRAAEQKEPGTGPGTPKRPRPRRKTKHR